MREYTKADIVEAIRIFNASSRLYKFNRDEGLLQAKDTDGDAAGHSRNYREIEAAFACLLLEYDSEMTDFQVEAAESQGYPAMMRRIRAGEPDLMRTLMGALETALEREQEGAGFDAGHGGYRDSYGGRAGHYDFMDFNADGDDTISPPDAGDDEHAHLLQAADLLLVADENWEAPEDHEGEFPLAADYIRANRFDAAALNEKRESCTHLFNITAEGAIPNAKFWNSDHITIRLTPAVFGHVRCGIQYA